MERSFKQLVVWRKSIDLVGVVYRATSQFPREEKYGLAIQMRRAAVSIPSNIAEGSRRRNLREYLQFLSVADASSAELETQIIISHLLYPAAPFGAVEPLLEEIQKMLTSLMRKLTLRSNIPFPKT